MTFLAPMALWGAVVAVPVVLLYLVRQRARRIEVSNFPLWEEPASRVRESLHWRRLRQPLSLLAQLLFVALVVAALARPSRDGEAAPRGAVLVLDRSLSMAAGPAPSRIEQARRALRERIGGGEHSLLASGPVLGSAWTSSRRALIEAIAGVEPSDSAMEPTATLRVAKALAGGSGVVFATDAVWDGPAALPPGIESVRVGKPGPNAGITRFAARRNPAAPAEVHVFAEVARSAPGGGAAQFELTRDGALLDAREVAPAAGAPWRSQWQFLAPGAVTLAARIAGYPGDVLEADDRYSIRMPALDTIRVILVSPPDRYLEAAFDALPAVDFARVWPAESLTYGDPGALYVFRGGAPPADFQAAGAVAIAPATDSAFGRRTGEPEPVAAIAADERSPVTRHLDLARLGTVSAARYEPPPGARVVVAGADRPLVFGDWEGDRKWLLLAFDPSTTSLVERAAFPVLIGNLVQGLREKAVEVATGSGGAATTLEPQGDPSPIEQPPAPVHVPGALWRWLLALAALWAVLEWWSYHRRITE